jgi:hypothetical protein
VELVIRMQEVEKRDEISWKLPPRAYGSCQLAAAFMWIVNLDHVYCCSSRAASARRVMHGRKRFTSTIDRRGADVANSHNRCQTHELPYAQAKDSRTGVQLPSKRAVCVGVRFSHSFFFITVLSFPYASAWFIFYHVLFGSRSIDLGK